MCGGIRYLGSIKVIVNRLFFGSKEKMGFYGWLGSY